MATPQARRFEDIIAWQRGNELQIAIHAAVRSHLRSDPGLGDQLYRAARSVTANIAEGFERNSRGDFARFLAMAKGSAGEIRAHLYECRTRDLIPETEFQVLKSQAELVSGTIAKLRAAVLDQRKRQ